MNIIFLYIIDISRFILHHFEQSLEIKFLAGEMTARVKIYLNRKYGDLSALMELKPPRIRAISLLLMKLKESDNMKIEFSLNPTQVNRLYGYSLSNLIKANILFNLILMQLK